MDVSLLLICLLFIRNNNFDFIFSPDETAVCCAGWAGVGTQILKRTSKWESEWGRPRPVDAWWGRYLSLAATAHPTQPGHPKSSIAFLLSPSLHSTPLHCTHSLTFPFFVCVVCTCVYSAKAENWREEEGSGWRRRRRRRRSYKKKPIPTTNIYVRLRLG